MPTSKRKMQGLQLTDLTLHNISYHPTRLLNIRWVLDHQSPLTPVLYFVVRTLLKIVNPISVALLRANRFLVERVVL